MMPSMAIISRDGRHDVTTIRPRVTDAPVFLVAEASECSLIAYTRLRDVSRRFWRDPDLSCNALRARIVY
jgi:hypothetical protein